MPPRITEKSGRPRVSDRTMVGNSATRLACAFPRTEGRRHDTNMKPQRGRSIAGPSLRGLWGRSATGHNGQAAQEEVSAMWRGAGCRKIISGLPAGRSVFHLTSPFIGLTENFGLCGPRHFFAATSPQNAANCVFFRGEIVDRFGLSAVESAALFGCGGFESRSPLRISILYRQQRLFFRHLRRYYTDEALYLQI
jgi:hypothetical protein